MGERQLIILRELEVAWEAKGNYEISNGQKLSERAVQGILNRLKNDGLIKVDDYDDKEHIKKVTFYCLSQKGKNTLIMGYGREQKKTSA